MHDGFGYGYINVAGEFVVPPIYHCVTDFSGGRGHVQIDGKVGFVDRQGDEVIARRFGDADWFHEGLAAVMEWDPLLHGPAAPRYSAYAGRESRKPMGYIDAHGRYAVEPAFIVAGSFSEGLAAVQYDIDEWGFIDRAGDIRPMGPNCPFDFREGLCRFEDGGGKTGFVDADLGVVIPPVYRQAFDFCEGVAWVREERGQTHSHFLTAGGERALTFDDHCDEEFSDGLLTARRGNGWGYVNKRQEWVVPPVYWPTPATFNEGLATIAVAGKKGFINTLGGVVAEPAYDNLYPLSNGLAAVLVEGPWGFLNPDGDMAIEPRFASPGTLAEGMCGVGISAE